AKAIYMRRVAGFDSQAQELKRQGETMATLARELPIGGRPDDHLSGTPRAHSADRWIFVAMAMWFIGIVLVGFIPDSVMKLDLVVPLLENILLLQINAGVLFAVLMTIALRARATNSGLHKRMVFLATAVPLGAAIDRMSWLPSSMPANPWATDAYVLAALAP